MSETKELAIKEQNHASYIESKKEVIVKMLGLSGATAQDLDVAFTQFKRTGLDPVTRQIYAMINNGKLSIMASIDGLRLIAERSGAYEGQTAPQWCGDDGVWKDVWLSKATPRACKIGVYKTKFREPLVAIALFDEYAGKYAYDDNKYNKFKKGDLTFMWQKMPALMIAKVAEALALRKAFPNEMSGIYSTEEMDQSQSESVGAQNAREAAELLNDSGFRKEASKPLEKEATNAKTEEQKEFVIGFGKHKDKTFSQINLAEVQQYIEWIPTGLKGKDDKPITGKLKLLMEETYREGLKYIAQRKDEALSKKDPEPIDLTEEMNF